MISSWFYLEITYQILSFKQKISFLIYTFTVILCKHIRYIYGIFTFLYTCKSIYLLQFLCVVSSYLYIFISTTESQKRRKSRSVSHLSVLKMKTKQKQTSRVAFTVCLGAHASSAAMLSSHGRLLSSSRRSLRISCTAVMSTVSLWSTPLNRPRRWRLST